MRAPTCCGSLILSVSFFPCIFKKEVELQKIRFVLQGLVQVLFIHFLRQTSALFVHAMHVWVGFCPCTLSMLRIRHSLSMDGLLPCKLGAPVSISCMRLIVNWFNSAHSLKYLPLRSGIEKTPLTPRD